MEPNGCQVTGQVRENVTSKENLLASKKVGKKLINYIAELLC